MKDLCGNINSKNGFHDFNLTGKIKNIIKDINKNYGMIEEEKEDNDNDEVEDDYEHEMEADYGEFDD